MYNVLCPCGHNITTSKEKFQCRKCGKRYPTKDFMLRHEQETPDNTNKSSYTARIIYN